MNLISYFLLWEINRCNLSRARAADARLRTLRPNNRDNRMLRRIFTAEQCDFRSLFGIFFLLIPKLLSQIFMIR